MTNTGVERHMVSNSPALNVRMIQIPFTIEYTIKENKTKHN
jgi:hypothetical protein